MSDYFLWLSAFVSLLIGLVVFAVVEVEKAAMKRRFATTKTTDDA